MSSGTPSLVGTVNLLARHHILGSEPQIHQGERVPTFSNTSKDRLDSCHDDLSLICRETIKRYPHHDFSIICGHRTKGAQEEACRIGASKVHWPDSKHNSEPSMAVDIAPYPIDWNNAKAFNRLSDCILETARQLLAEGRVTHRLRWGGDWDMDGDTTDQRFNDLPHFELVLEAE